MKRKPYFSIVTPVHNREREIRQAIDSCLAQDFPDFEVIVVDGASSDGTATIVNSYVDPRVRLIRHACNRGVCPARNSAIRASTGDWIIYLDSDHELLPGCLSRVFEVVSRDTDRIGRFGFMYDFDDGRVSPCPLPPDGILGYEDWLRFSERARWSDALWVTRRDTFDRCTMPESFGPEFRYNLDFSRNFTWRIVPEILAFQHTDSPVRLSFFRQTQDPEKEVRRELDWIEEWDGVLAEHGQALRELAPNRYQGTLRGKAVSYVLTGQQRRAMKASLECLVRYPGSLVNWMLLLATLFGKRATRWARTVRARRNSFARPEDKTEHLRFSGLRAGQARTRTPEGPRACGI